MPAEREDPSGDPASQPSKGSSPAGATARSVPLGKNRQQAFANTAPIAESVPSLSQPQGGANPNFSSTEIVGGRYRIARLLAEGGMGEVYEADDSLLGERVALKTIRQTIAQDNAVIGRFKREIQLARKVTHPNVCRIFDVGFHKPADADGDSGEIAFLTMELLEGETLSSRIRRLGRMTAVEALPLVSQMATGLAAAHKAGVIHRDFKSANVVLAPGSKNGELRAVVTDFGLARPMEDQGNAAVTGNGGIVGSPSYMAPEQVEGGAVTARSDIYALGVVMYEIITGKLPFVGETPLATAVKRLKEKAPSPSKLAPGLDPVWDQVILRCLERNPADRPGSALEVLHALDPDAPEPRIDGDSTTSKLSGELRRRRRFKVLGLAGAAALLGIGAFAVLKLTGGGPSRPTSTRQSIPALAPDTHPGRRSVAVLGFKNLSGREEVGWLSTALSEMLGTELSAGDKMRAVPGEIVSRAKQQLNLGDSDSYAPDTLVTLHDTLGTDYVLVGSYLALGGKDGKIRFDLRLQDTVTGQTVASVSDSGSEAELTDLVTRTGAKLREKLAIEKVTEEEAQEVQAAQPTNPESARSYSEGVAQLRLDDCGKAYAHLEKAVKADPDYPLAHVAYAEAASCLGYTELGREHAKKAVDLSTHLPEHIRLATEALHSDLNGDHDRAEDLLGKLFKRFPDNIDYGYRLADAQNRNNHVAEARKTLEQMRKMPAPLGNHPKLDLVEIALMFNEDSSSEHIRASLVAIEKRAVIANAPHVATSARWRLALNLWVAGDHAGALEKLAAAAVHYQQSGDEDGVALMSMYQAQVLTDMGDVEGATIAIDRAGAVVEKIRDLRQVPFLKQITATLRLVQGDVEGARRLCEEGRMAAVELGETGAGLGLCVANLMTIMGELKDAHELSNQMVAKIKRDPELARPSELSFLSDDLAGAKRIVSENLARAEKRENRLQISALKAQLAKITLEEGNAVEAERLLREAESTYSTTKSIPPRIVAGVLLAEALLAQGKVAEAKVAIDAARALLGDRRFVGLRLLTNRTTAKVLAASGKPEDLARAEELLAQIAQSAKQSGYLVDALWSRLALGEVQLRAGKNTDARELLAAVSKEANGRGAKLIARKATTVARARSL
jgi:eukaryotic-like serine/threonine-protein kinase